MTNRPKKPCSYPRCPNLTEGAYCPQHTKVKQETTQESNKQYDRYRRDAQSTTFYKSKAWRQLRQVVFNKQYGLCQSCLRDNKFVKGNVVDHKIPIKKDWDKRLEESNLQVLCHKCHNRKTQNDKNYG